MYVCLIRKLLMFLGRLGAVSGGRLEKGGAAGL